MVLSSTFGTVKDTMLSTKLSAKLSTKTFSKKYLILLCSGIVLLTSCSKESDLTSSASTSSTDTQSVPTTSADAQDDGKEVSSLLAKTLVNMRLTLTGSSDPTQVSETVVPVAILVFDSKGNSEVKLLRASDVPGELNYRSILVVDGATYSQVDVGVPGGAMSTKWVTTGAATNSAPTAADPLALLTAGSTNTVDCLKTASYKETKADTWEVLCASTMQFPLIVGLKDSIIEYIQYSNFKLSYEFLKDVEMVVPPKDVLEGDSAEKALMSSSLSTTATYIGNTIIQSAVKQAPSPAEISIEDLVDAANSVLADAGKPQGDTTVLDLYPAGEVTATYVDRVLTVSHSKYKFSCSTTIDLVDDMFVASPPICVG